MPDFTLNDIRQALAGPSFARTPPSPLTTALAGVPTVNDPDTLARMGAIPGMYSPDSLGAVKQAGILPTDDGLRSLVTGSNPESDPSANWFANAAQTGMLATPLGMIKPYRANWRGETGQFDTDYFHSSPDPLIDEKGATIAEKDALSPKEGISFDIPVKREKGIIYRGMSADEYADMLKSGRIKSKGDYNLGNQSGLTYFSRDPDSAAFYANSFAPKQYKATFEKPAYVVAIKEPESHRIKDVPGTGADEVGVDGEIPSTDIVGVYQGNVVRHVPGLEERGFSRAPSSSLVWKKIGGIGALGVGLGGAAAASGMYPTEQPKKGPTPVAIMGTRG